MTDSPLFSLQSLPELSELPAVSYVMPVLNEEGFLETSVRTILSQDYGGEKEIVLALGPSRDRSNDIATRLAAEDPRVRLVDNPARDIPAGLNLAVAMSRNPVVVRVDAHSELSPDYTRRGIEALRNSQASSVGGIMRAMGSSGMQRAIARGYNSPFGLGGGAYHGEGQAGPAESAYLGIFRREALEAVGGYDPQILRGEDWELNLRIRRAGGIVWFDPALRVTYWPRETLRDLSKQFFATGVWRAVLVRRYGRANPWRFFVPGILVVALTASALGLMLLVLGILPWLSLWSLLILPTAGYLSGIVFAALRIPEQRGIKDRMRTAVTLMTMHLSWGSGFLRGITLGGGRVVDRSRVSVDPN